jgi:hypothetical protein
MAATVGRTILEERMAPNSFISQHIQIATIRRLLVG